MGSKVIIISNTNELVRVKPATVVVSNLTNGDIAPTQEFHVLFCGYLPADKPKYSIIVSMNKFGLPASGGAMAGPVVHNIVDWMIGNGY